MFKKIIRKILANLGFKLININFPEVRFENFNNLTQVYEEKLNNIIGAKLIEAVVLVIKDEIILCGSFSN